MASPGRKQTTQGGLSKDPAARQRQLANVGHGKPSAIHGAYSPAKLAPIRKAILSELTATFPGVRQDRLELAAAQRARVVLLQDYVDQRGIVRHRKHGTTVPAADLLAREEARYLKALGIIESLARDGAQPSAPGDVTKLLAEMAAEHEAGQ